MAGKKLPIPRYRIGGPIEIGLNQGGRTSWVAGTVVQLVPQIKVDVDGITKTSGSDFIFHRPTNDPDAKAGIPKELDPELAAPIYKAALVKILQETNTTRPNATVQRVIHIVKEALGELDS
ncbi:hypothetical protein PP747_gp018 [Rhizobium phage RHph_Y38]|uniref:Uncharacterized protein n=2 Tax=Acanvirus TaxID=3044653 RepID=A0A7S5USL8_9CAUD|nr:hypothetical protein PP747_gp018 [Rhizobium phage RHph_Y38]YP_010658230.1 hypothetical protein PP749_gp019 [Rhizobium phage RHEph22]QIG67719.1 hypothetical protein EVB52_018 [Rhizobium phage RHph_Y38]QXV74692.1 hypothetical protein [Rhizobium phage RHEph22]QXV74788.1 hypothetical protein [Rhizobium phage RHEph24]